MAKKRYYVVKKGKTPGIYATWDECKSQVDGYPKAVYKGFASWEEVRKYAGDDPFFSAYESEADFHKTYDGKPAATPTDKHEISGMTDGKPVATPIDKHAPSDIADDMASYPPTADGTAIAYVDGSFNETSGVYGAGVVFFIAGEKYEYTEVGSDPDIASMRNVAGELLASMYAMREAKRRRVKKLTIYHDYQGIASWCSGKWRAKNAHTQTYTEYYKKLSAVVDISFVKVSGHSGDKWNDRADRLAKQAALSR